MPYGMLPVLEIDGKPIAQSNAVARYLAHEHNLAGKDEWESMLCDVLVDTLGDLKQCKWYICLVQSTTVPKSRLQPSLPLSLSTPTPNRYSFSPVTSLSPVAISRFCRGSLSSTTKVPNRSHCATVFLLKDLYTRRFPTRI